MHMLLHAAVTAKDHGSGQSHSTACQGYFTDFYSSGYKGVSMVSLMPVLQSDSVVTHEVLIRCAASSASCTLSQSKRS